MFLFITLVCHRGLLAVSMSTRPYASSNSLSKEASSNMCFTYSAFGTICFHSNKEGSSITVAQDPPPKSYASSTEIEHHLRILFLLQISQWLRCPQCLMESHEKTSSLRYPRKIPEILYARKQPTINLPSRILGLHSYFSNDRALSLFHPCR